MRAAALAALACAAAAAGGGAGRPPAGRQRGESLFDAPPPGAGEGAGGGCAQPPELRGLCQADAATVWLTFSNWGYFGFLANWLLHAERLGVTRRELLIGALDDRIASWSSARRLAHIVMNRGLAIARQAGFQVHDVAKTTAIADTDFRGQPAVFHKMGTEKTALILTLLLARRNVLVSDADTVWLRDPLPVLRRLRDTDVVLSTDCPSIYGDREVERPLRSRCGHFTGARREVAVNTGIVWWNGSSDAARAAARAWVAHILESPEEVYDQQALVEVLTRGMFPVRRVPGTRSIWAMGNRVRMGTFPASHFCNGHVYFVQRKPQQLGIRPYVIHPTFQIQAAAGKRMRYREAGLWLYDTDSYYSEGGFVTFAAAPPPHLLRQKPGIEAHQRLVEWYLGELQAAAAVALALNRTVVLPQLLCYCDFYWGAPIVPICVVYGADVSLPFECPADYVFNLYAWDKNARHHKLPGAEQRPLIVPPDGSFAVPYREASFLDNARLPSGVRGSQLTVYSGAAAPAPGQGADAILIPAGSSVEAVSAAVAAAGAAPRVLHFAGSVADLVCGPGEEAAHAAYAEAMQAALRYEYCCLPRGHRLQVRADNSFLPYAAPYLRRCAAPPPAADEAAEPAGDAAGGVSAVRPGDLADAAAALAGLGGNGTVLAAVAVAEQGQELLLRLWARGCARAARAGGGGAALACLPGAPAEPARRAAAAELAAAGGPRGGAWVWSGEAAAARAAAARLILGLGVHVLLLAVSAVLLRNPAGELLCPPRPAPDPGAGEEAGACASTGGAAVAVSGEMRSVALDRRHGGSYLQWGRLGGAAVWLRSSAEAADFAERWARCAARGAGGRQEGHPDGLVGAGALRSGGAFPGVQVVPVRGARPSRLLRGAGQLPYGVLPLSAVGSAYTHWQQARQRLAGRESAWAASGAEHGAALGEAAPATAARLLTLPELRPAPSPDSPAPLHWPWEWGEALQQQQGVHSLLPDGVTPPPQAPGVAASRIARHLTAMAEQRAELARAVAAALLLRRPLHIPQFVCYCDTVDPAVDLFASGCSHPGSEAAVKGGEALPFPCPLDHVLNPAAVLPRGGGDRAALSLAGVRLLPAAEGAAPALPSSKLSLCLQTAAAGHLTVAAEAIAAAAPPPWCTRCPAAGCAALPGALRSSALQPAARGVLCAAGPSGASPGCG